MSVAVRQTILTPFFHSFIPFGHCRTCSQIFVTSFRHKVGMEHHQHPKVRHLHDFGPVDGVVIGEHPLVTRLMKGVFMKRPSRRKVPVVWNPSKVLDVFQHWLFCWPLLLPRGPKS
jgi:hypothetical protein